MNPTSSKPLVVSVVLTWNDTEMTTDCVDSLRHNDYENMRILLVDNGSDSPCGDTVKAMFPDIELLVLPENVGFSGGVNRGMQYALQQWDPDYIQLVGNDSTIDRHGVRELVRAMEDRREIGIASPLLLNRDEELTVQFYTSVVDRRNARHDIHDFACSEASREWPNVHNDFVPFVAPMLRRKLINELGLLDESYGTSFEDFDYCLKTRDAGWEIVTVGRAKAVHGGSCTTGKISPYITYFRTRNRLICMFRHNAWHSVLGQPIHLLRTFYWQVKRYGFTNWACHRAFVRGWYDFLRGVRGEGWAAQGSTQN